MITRRVKVLAPIFLILLLLVGGTVWGGMVNKDRDWQIMQKRLCECQSFQQIPAPVVKDGLKDGGDLIWWFQGIENVVCVSKFVDVDGDALPDVLVETYDAGAPQQDHFYCIKGNSPGYGTVLWSCRPPGGPSNSGGYGDQCVSYTEDVNGDGHPDALLGTAWGGRTAYTIDGQNGDVVWSYDTYDEPPYESGWIYSICPIRDLNGDGIDDVLFGAGSDADAAFCVDGTNGNLIWKFSAYDAVFAVAEIADVNTDGKNDALIGAGDSYDDRIICVSGASTGSATVLWEHSFGASVHDVAAIEDVNGDGVQDALAGVWNGYVYCRSGANGAHIWSYYVGLYQYVMRVVPIDDIDDDGIQDVLIGSWLNAIICVSGVNGAEICSYTVGTLNGGDVWTVDAIDDVNGDGYPEALGGSFDYKVYCVDLRACSTLWTYYTGNRVFTVRGLPDVNGDGTPDALAGTQMLGKSGGKAYCISGGIPLDTVPHIVSTTPAQNELNVPVNTDISVTFDIDMDQTTINDSTFVVNAWSTGLHQGTITYNSGTKTAILDPDSNFAVGEIVTVVLTTDIQSSYGCALESSYVWSFTTEVSEESPGTFAPDSVYPVGESPWSVFAADLDDDGYEEIITANSGSDNVSVLLNNGDGTFASDSVYPVGEEPWSVFAADLDGDGYSEIITANMYDNTVSVLLNNGDGTFATQSVYPVDEGPVSVFAADLDGDGDLDMTTANMLSDNVSVLLNNGNGTFAPHSTYPVGDLTMPVSVFAADVDGDGDLDLQTANYGSYDVAVLLNDGNGTFTLSSLYPVGDLPLSVFAADLNGDGDLDLETANCYSDSVSVLLNNGDGTFGTHSAYPAGDGPWSVFAVDVDGDEDLDLATASEFSSDVSVLLNDGDGSFTPHSVYPVGDEPYSIFAADLDGDGDLDLATANHGSDNVSVLFNCLYTGDCNGDSVVNIGDVVYLIGYLYRDGPAPDPEELGDVNCDGIVELGDVVYLINYVFKGGPPPKCC
ncbi:MAG: VCBS repeat-containing protein [candidate division Zixibacteria bacterium]|nr:VCBS repeat-containing protein [candidate division Zixibacteria bacterium]